MIEEIIDKWFNDRNLMTIGELEDLRVFVLSMRGTNEWKFLEKWLKYKIEVVRGMLEEEGMHDELLRLQGVSKGFRTTCEAIDTSLVNIEIEMEERGNRNAGRN